MSSQRPAKKPTMRQRANARDPRSARPGAGGSSRLQRREQLGQEHRAQAASARAAGASRPTYRRFLLPGLGALLVLALGVGFAHLHASPEGRQDGNGAGSSGAEASGSAADSAVSAQFSVSFTTTGDLIFWREVADYIDANGGASAMANISDLLSGADVTISNLESPLSNDESEPVPAKDVYIIGRPQAIDGMVESGIDIVSLANNHIMDYTAPALQDTLEALDGAGILHAGAGMDEAAADAIVETEVNGARIAFISWTDIIPDYYIAYGDEPGVASMRLNTEAALERVREAKKTHDIVIVAMHWGVEYQDYFDEAQQRLPAHQLVEAGADVVLGNHPHVLQGIEFYQGSLISYAHGNCVFRQSFDFGNTHESYVLCFDVSQDGIGRVEVVPLYLSDEYGIPSVATGEQAQATLERLVQISEGLNTSFDIQGDVAYASPISAD